MWSAPPPRATSAVRSVEPSSTISHSTESKPSTSRGSAVEGARQRLLLVQAGDLDDQLHASADGRAARLTSPLRGAPVHLLPAHPARGPRRRRGALAPADGPRRPGPPARARDCGPGCPAGYRVIKRVEAIIREEIDAIGGQEMLMPVLQPAELWKRTGRYRDRRSCSSSKDRKGSAARPRDDARGGGDLPRRPRDPLLPRAAEDPLPRADQGARRAAAARGRAAHARVHDEGRVLLRPRPGGARRELRAPPPRLRAHLRALRAALVRGRVATSG